MLEADSEGRPPDPQQIEARKVLEAFFEERRDQVFYLRQIEILHEDKYFHWVTRRALQELMDEGVVRREVRMLRTGTSIHLIWHRSNRYYKRRAGQVVELVEEFSDPNFIRALGMQGEVMILEGFARFEFVLKGRNVREFQGKRWRRTGHDVDFVFERDNVAYGVEVKNTLGYMDYREFGMKIEMCRIFGVHPVFAVRMMPKSWMKNLIDSGGYGMILKYQLYPWGYGELAKRVVKGLGLPVDVPQALADGTMQRFVRWHGRNV